MLEWLKKLGMTQKDVQAKGTPPSPGNLSMRDQCFMALKEVVGFYAQQGSCPCAFPRFGQLVGFDFRKFGTTPVGCHATELAIGIVIAEGGVYQKRADGNWACSVCGSAVETEWEQYNINLDVTVMRWKTNVAKVIGAEPREKITMPAGFFGFQRESVVKCSEAFVIEGPFAAMESYLKAIRVAATT